ncbi:hypothetical protein Lepto7376_1127 [[Leptolyngbya] sp. PCC 7376]|nr:hypothetical protein Lepto7376_1127 [[Leptolyngbya] sp. PCC 7376]
MLRTTKNLLGLFSLQGSRKRIMCVTSLYSTPKVPKTLSSQIFPT